MTFELTPELKERYPDTIRANKYGKRPVGYGPPEESGNEFILRPDPSVVFFLEQAFDFIDAGNSFRETNEWLNQKLKTNLAFATLRNLYLKHRQPFIKKSETNKRTRQKHSAATKKIIAEKARLRAQIKASEKKITQIQNRSKAHKPHKKTVVIPKDELPDLPTEKYSSQIFSKAPVNTQVLFKPNPGPQTDFLSAPEEEVLYGGAAGGEPKSWFSASFHSNVSK